MLLYFPPIYRVFANRTSLSSEGTHLSVNGNPAGVVDNLELVSRQLNMYINGGVANEESSIFVDSYHSRLKLARSNQSSPGPTHATLSVTITTVICYFL